MKHCSTIVSQYKAFAFANMKHKRLHRLYKEELFNKSPASQTDWLFCFLLRRIFSVCFSLIVLVGGFFQEKLNILGRKNSEWTQDVRLPVIYYRRIKTQRGLEMLKIILFFIVVSLVYRQIDLTQQKQGGKPLAKSPVILSGCGFLILLIVILTILNFYRGRF